MRGRIHCNGVYDNDSHQQHIRPGLNGCGPAGDQGLELGRIPLSGIWAIGNRTWIGLLSFVPYIGFVMAIILGMKGSDWAWQNRQWDSVEHFKQVQKIWMYWGIGIVGVAFLLGLLGAILLPVFVAATRAAQGGL